MSETNDLVPQNYNESDLQKLIIELRKSKADLEARRFVEANLARFSSIIRFQPDDTLEKWADRIMDELVSCVNGLQGAFYVAEENEYYQSQLRLIGTFAYDKKHLATTIPFGEGLIGQAAKSQKPYYLNANYQLQPKTYSSLAQLELKSVIIQPLIFNDRVEGLIEISSGVEFSPQEIELVRSLSENIAANLRSVQQQATLKRLFEEAQKKAQQLEAQEEVMRQNMEELRATQEEMKRVERELKAQDEAINRAYATAQLDLEGNIIFCNTLYAQLSGYTQEELIMQSLQKLWVPSTALEAEYKQFWHQLRQGEVISGRFKRLRKDGSIYYIQASYSPVLGIDKKPLRVAEFAWDITEQVKAEQNLTNTNDELRAQIQAIHRYSLVLELDSIGNILHANRNFLALSNFTEENLKSQPFTQLLDQEARGAFEEAWARLRMGEAINQEVKLQPNGKNQIVWMHAIMIPLFETGKLSKVLVFACDITPRKEQSSLLQKAVFAYRRQQEETQKLKEMLRMASKQIQKLQAEKKFIDTTLSQFLAILNLDMQGNILKANSFFFTYFSLEPATTIGKPFDYYFRFVAENNNISAPDATDTTMLWQNWIHQQVPLPKQVEYIATPQNQLKTICHAFYFREQASEEGPHILVFLLPLPQN
ncbi:MAG: PAS domain S-box protein [Bacteroidia bacterium]|nr:PAS domain S-box protein [Bacteroidia bacterium]MDW8158198.1 PAS domain S-box protein [Bacteroidia bacterium]